MEVALYTAIYGNSDWVKPIPYLENPGTGGQMVPAYLYTDSKQTADDAEALGWEPRIVDHRVATLRGDPRITAPMLAHKWWKTHPDLACPGVEVSLWIDGSMEVKVDDYVHRCIAALGEDDWACVPHPARNCIYPEAEFSATLTWRYDAPSILNQARFYRNIVGHPAGWGLIATGANVRRHAPNVLELSDQWWTECINWSHQDQLSLPVLLRLAEGKVKFNYNLPWFQWWHLHEHGGRHV